MAEPTNQSDLSSPIINDEKNIKAATQINADSLEEEEIVDRKHEKQLLRKLDLHLLPVLTLLYLLSFLDRSNGLSCHPL